MLLPLAVPILRTLLAVRKSLASARNSNSRGDSHLRSGGAQVTHESTGTHREAGFRVDLILGCYSKASVTVSCCPGEIHSRLQLLIHLLIDGATKLRPVISANKHRADAKTPRQAGWRGAELPTSHRGQGGCKRTHLLTKQAPNYRKAARNGTDTRVGRFGARDGYSNPPWEHPMAAQSSAQAPRNVKFASKMLSKNGCSNWGIGIRDSEWFLFCCWKSISYYFFKASIIKVVREGEHVRGEHARSGQQGWARAPQKSGYIAFSTTSYSPCSGHSQDWASPLEDNCKSPAYGSDVTCAYCWSLQQHLRSWWDLKKSDLLLTECFCLSRWKEAQLARLLPLFQTLHIDSGLWQQTLPLPDIFNINKHCQMSASSFWVFPVETTLETVKAEPVCFRIQSLKLTNPRTKWYSFIANSAFHQHTLPKVGAH